ncbi:hypothetical protein BHM03_00007440 [Ensete ventricosum]|nr:hypothetical protein BHM03_00007440 [Ensete ventricosum]
MAAARHSGPVAKGPKIFQKSGLHEEIRLSLFRVRKLSRNAVSLSGPSPPCRLRYLLVLRIPHLLVRRLLITGVAIPNGTYARIGITTPLTVR